MNEPLPRAAKRSRLTKVVLSATTRNIADLSFVQSKLRHMREIMGLEAEIGPHGGAAPKWLMDEFKERRKRLARKNP